MHTPSPHTASAHTEKMANLSCAKNQGTQTVPVVIVGNKSDLRPEQRQVTEEEGRKVGEKLGCAWIEASARYDQNVAKAFELMIGEIEKSQNPGEPPQKSNCLLM